MQPYKNRQAAGRELTNSLSAYKGHKNTIVLALPRGGVPVAYEIAHALKLPLNIFIVRKLGFPENKEFAFGAIAPNNTLFLNKEIIAQYQLPPIEIEQIIQQEQQELKRRMKLYCQDNIYPSLKAKEIILVDDGIATGATMQVAIHALYQLKVARVVVAVPVAASEVCTLLKTKVDEFICPLQIENFSAVGQWYADFEQITDAEVITLLQQNH